MLFDVFNNSNTTKDDPPTPTAHQSGTGDHSLILTSELADLHTTVPVLLPGTVYDFISFGQWSLAHILIYILSLTGPADVYATTYGLSPDVVRKLVEAKEKGMIREMTMVMDWKIRTYKAEAYFVAEQNFKTRLCSIHAKVTVVINETWGVIIQGSANYTRNNKIENNIITVDRERAIMHAQWISKLEFEGYGENN
jgi:hypothetical protein